MQHLFKANQTNKKIQPCKIHPLPLVLLLFGMMLLLPETASAQELERLWYIANDKALENEPTFDYNNSTPEQRYYIVPAKDPALTDLSDAYFSEDYTVSYGDPEKPFLTTYKTNRDVNSAWVIKSDGDGKFYLIHVLTGKYAVYQTTPDCTAKPHRKVIHLETLTVPENDNRTRFYIENGTTTYTFRPQSLSSGNRYFNPSGGNKDFYNAQGGDCNNTGLIGVYSDPSNRGSKWHLEAALLTAPTISEVDPNTNTVTVTEVNGLPPGYNIHYTTDGADPTASSPTLSGGVYTVEETCTLKAVVERYGIVLTEVQTASLVPAIPDVPTFTTECDNTLTFTCGNLPEAHIYYTMTTDGSEPAVPTNSSTLYDGQPLTLANGDKVKAIAYNLPETLHSNVSAVHTHQNIHTAAPTIEMTNSNTITITGPVVGSTIYYTINSGDPTTSSTSGSSPVNIPYDGSSMDIRAIAQVAPLEVSCVARLVTVATPTMTITEEDCAEPSPIGNLLTISSPDDCTLWYAVTAGENSPAPDINDNPNPYSLYTSPIPLDDLDGSNTDYTVHAYARASDGTSTSTVISQSHQMKTGGKPTLTPPTGSSPVVLISGGVYGDVAVCSAEGVAVQEIPIASDGTAEYSIPDGASGTLTVSFKHGSSWLLSCEATYVLPSAPATPTYSQGCDNLISLHCTTPMADIHYTTDGEEPTLASPTYTNGCLDDITVGTTVKAKAFLGFRSSATLSFEYQHVNAEVPVFYVDGTNVSMTGPTGTTIYYTTSVGTQAGVVPADPADPTSESTAYSGPITIAGSNIITVFKAIAIPENPEQASCVVRVETREGYSINVASDLDKLNTYPGSYFFVMNDIDAGDYPTNTVNEFTGVLDGNYHTISNLGKPLFNTISGNDSENNAAVLNLMLKNVTISTEGNAGAIANNATGYTRIYNCGILPNTPSGVTTSTISGSAYVGGLVGFLDGSARVINCFSYATINGGTHRAGIVGYNNYASKSNDLKTMVMNCMFYGDINTEGSCTIYPVYGGLNIHNKYVNASNTGLNNYCYFYYNGDYVNHINDNDYHGSLGAEERFLNRFEFFRLTLNSTRDVAAFYVYNSAEEKELMAKWVLDKSIAPYPILKAPGYYPSIINPDTEHVAPIDADNVHYNEGRKLGTLTVYIQKGTGGAVFNNGDASITTSPLTLNITDKDIDKPDLEPPYVGNYDFNYKKVQLPYYNQVGTGNYTNNLVVTGWKIVDISPAGTGNFTTNASNNNTGVGHDFPDWNFVDRTCTDKDLYSVSGRVFNQGAYWEVPDGVTSITIEPYWAKAAYLSDACYDRTYSNSISGNNVTTNNYDVTVAGSRLTSFNEQTVYNFTGNAIDALDIQEEGSTVYDYAVVLVGNYHQNASSSLYSSGDKKPVTFMSADLDGDCEPDNTLFYYHNSRQVVAPIRFDFLNMPGIGMVKRTWDSGINPQPGIFQPKSWFEITNTVVVRFGQFEYADKYKTVEAPCILQGGVYEQFVSAKDGNAQNTNYLLVGGNAWFKNFANGCHTNTFRQTPKIPINVAGGDYEHFYLTGIYQPNNNPNDENAECYIDGGRFGEVAGAGMQRIDGNVTWLINAADIEDFFGGGINAAQSITGDVTTTISNSRVVNFYGGPKFGAMASGKKVTTTATNCQFNTFFGAGYGGTSLNRVGMEDVTLAANFNTASWGTYVSDHYKRCYETTHHSNSGSGANITVNAISTSYEYEYILHSDGSRTVARFFTNYASLSMASTQDVESNLTGCKMTNFYGGGRLGAVNGDVNSVLTDCTVEGDVFGSGYTSEASDVAVMPIANMYPAPTYNRRAGVFNDAQVGMPATVQYYWSNREGLSNDNPFYDVGDVHEIYTDVSLQGLGAVKGNATLTINGNSVVMGDVYGGGAKSSSNTNGGTAKIEVNINGGTFGDAESGTGGNIYGGGMGDADNAVTEGIVEVNIGNSTQSANNVVIHGSVYGCNNVNGSPKDNVTVNVYKTKHDGSNVVAGSGFAIANVFGGGNQAHYEPTTAGKMTTVHIHNCDNTIEYVYGGGNAANVGSSTTSSAAEVIIDGGHIGWVFGGGNGAGEDNPGANIFGNATVTYHAGLIDHLFGGSNEKGSISGTKTVSVLGDGSCAPMEIVELYGGNNKADAAGDISLTMACSNSSCKVDYLFGGSRMANISGNVELNVYGGEYDYVFGGNNLSGTITGDVTLNLYGGTINEAAFGGNKGGYDEGSVFHDGGTILGDITVNVEDQNLECPLEVNHVFGAGDLAIYTAPTGTGAREFNPMVNIKHIRTGQSITGNVYGGGNGNPEDSSQEPGRVTGNPKVTIGDITAGHESHIANINGNVFGGGNAAKVVGNTTVLMQKANSTVGQDIFGGGNLAMVTGATDVDIDNGTVTGSVFGGGNQAGVSTTDVAMTGGTVLSGIYGGCNTSGIVNGNISVGITGGTIGAANSHAVVHGGGFGNGTSTTGNVNVTVNGAGVNIWGDVYGGSAKGHVNDASSNQTNVTLTSGTLHGDLYGGGLGDNENAALVKGAVQVTVNGGTVTGSVYGCNNVNGAPQNTVKVDIYGTDTPASGYALNAVFGGGNAASYAGTPVVIVHNCDNSIGYVYGGGNAASVAATDVTIYGGNVIGNVFGGGNGTVSAANVTGNTLTKIYGGTILKVFGGSNSQGTIGGTITVNALSQTELGGTSCAMQVGELYGGGNQAASQAGSITIGCMNDGDMIDYVYGGSNDADVTGDIVLTMTGGRIGNLFGGNNTGHSINGNITVTVNWNDGCSNNYLGNVYGGGNQAAYSGTPAVNIINGTVSGNVYGGGNDITTPNAGVAGSDVVMTGGVVLGGIYGGCNLNGSVTGDALVKVHGGTVGSSSGTRADVFGGGLGQNTKVNGNVTVEINQGSGVAAAPSIYGDVYGGSAKGLVNCTSSGNAQNGTAKTDVTLTDGTVYGNLYGGGLGEPSGAAADVWGPVTVTVSGGSISTYNDGADGGNVFGCNNYNGAPRISTSVLIEGGTIAHDVFGGGNLADVSLATHVTVSGGTVSRDVYGGGALANTGATTVDILGGTVARDIYGGGLGDGTHAPAENGVVTVNIGTGTPDPVKPFTVLPTGVDGEATIGGNVYGCNNTAGSPQDNVIVNVFKTAHTEGPDGNSTEGTGYAIANVFGGGNEADYAPSASGKKATVNVYTCDNTIRRVFGGGNAASAPEVETNIEGGHIHQVFGGGNGERGVDYAADITGNVHLNIHGGNVEQFFGGSNQNGHIGGSIYTDVTSDGPCGGMVINEFFCGSNEVDITGDVITTMTCSENMTVTNLYGGCNQANITGNVVLNIEGGTYTNVFGGSKGRLSGTNSPEDPGKSADITGNVTLNLKGGTIENAFGGSNVNGNIGGTITVNVVDVEDPNCPLYITNIYGGSNLTNYEPTYTPDPAPERISPVVNVIHIKHAIRGNVYGGSKGEVGSGTELHANPLVNIGYDASTMSGYVPAGYTFPSSPRAIVAGNVFGGGDAAKVVGNTEVLLRNRAKVFGNVYGGGNEGVVTGDTKVIVNGDNQ